MKKRKVEKLEHDLIPKHTIVSEQEKQEIMTEFKIKKISQFPKILKTDPVVKLIEAKPGDLLKIQRKDSIYYRTVAGD